MNTEEKFCLLNDELHEITDYMKSMLEDWIDDIPLGESRTAMELFDAFAGYLINNWEQ
jgi:hypothetical protein